MTPIRPARRWSNRAIIVLGLVICILAALFLAYFLGFFHEAAGNA